MDSDHHLQKPDKFLGILIIIFKNHINPYNQKVYKRSSNIGVPRVSEGGPRYMYRGPHPVAHGTCTVGPIKYTFALRLLKGPRRYSRLR